MSGSFLPEHYETKKTYAADERQVRKEIGTPKLAKRKNSREQTHTQVTIKGRNENEKKISTGTALLYAQYQYRRAVKYIVWWRAFSHIELNLKT